MKKIIVLLLACALLSGCAGSPVRTGWQADTNNRGMLKLKPDMTVEEVTATMGKPDKTEMYKGKNNETILVYLYISAASDTYAHFSDANYTPIVFVNGKLSGWGWSALNGSAQKYEFTVKNLY